MPPEPAPAFSSTSPRSPAEAASVAVELSVVVPAYNEAGRIGNSLTEICRYLDLRGQCYEVIPVSDGSTDGSAAEIDAAALRLSRPNARVDPLHLHVNLGKGAAVRAGVLRSRGAIVMYLDTDLSIPIAIAAEFMACIGAGADVAIASRYLPGSDAGSVRPVRRLLSAGYRELAAIILGIRSSDIQCGAKAFRRAVALALFQCQRLDGFSFDAEVLYLAAQAGCRVAEVPFTLVISKYSSVRLIAGSATMFLDLFRIRFNSARGFYKSTAASGKVGGGGRFKVYVMSWRSVSANTLRYPLPLALFLGLGQQCQRTLCGANFSDCRPKLLVTARCSKWAAAPTANAARLFIPALPAGQQLLFVDVAGVPAH